MKVILILCLLAVYINCEKLNQFDTCLKGIQKATDVGWNSVSEGLDKDWMDMVKYLLENSADGIQAQEDCKKVEPGHVMEWYEVHVSTKTKKCLSYLELGFRFALGQDWPTVVTFMKKFNNECALL